MLRDIWTDHINFIIFSANYYVTKLYIFLYGWFFHIDHKNLFINNFFEWFFSLSKWLVLYIFLLTLLVLIVCWFSYLLQTNLQSYVKKSNYLRYNVLAILVNLYLIYLLYNIFSDQNSVRSNMFFLIAFVYNINKKEINIINNRARCNLSTYLDYNFYGHISYFSTYTRVVNIIGTIKSIFYVFQFLFCMYFVLFLPIIKAIILDIIHRTALNYHLQEMLDVKSYYYCLNKPKHILERCGPFGV